MAYISARDIVVEFPIYNVSHRSLKKAFLHATTGGRLARDTGNRVVVRALDRASFDIREGDRVGLHGHNGAGKTTLLRVLSGIYEPVRGELCVQGRTAALLDLGLGIDPESTGYENILLRGILAGLRPFEIRNKIDEIAEFTELAEYLDMPVRTYSSGMQLRLAFAVSTSVHADILLMDEWLSVGDAAFAVKAQERLHSLVNRSPILVLASHSLELLTNVCTRVFSMEHGVIVERSIEELQSQLADNQTPGMGIDQITAAPPG